MLPGCVIVVVEGRVIIGVGYNRIRYIPGSFGCGRTTVPQTATSNTTRYIRYSNIPNLYTNPSFNNNNNPPR